MLPPLIVLLALLGLTLVITVIGYLYTGSPVFLQRGAEAILVLLCALGLLGLSALIKALDPILVPRGMLQRDARGNDVPLPEPDVRRAVLSSKELRKHFRIEASNGVPWARLVTSAATNVLFVAGIWGTALAYLHGSGTAWGFISLALLIACLATDHFRRRTLAMWDAATFERMNRCRRCGYDIANLATHEDGCKVCPECGAAWRVPISRP